ncbi:MAG: hypothetical protein DCC54_12295 [Anaerolineae bacterium]|nr:MAG: hypothetical protein DCC54_12295 [Anaerolineae bacterium]
MMKGAVEEIEDGVTPVGELVVAGRQIDDVRDGTLRRGNFAFYQLARRAETSQRCDGGRGGRRRDRREGGRDGGGEGRRGGRGRGRRFGGGTGRKSKKKQKDERKSSRLTVEHPTHYIIPTVKNCDSAL